MLHFSVEYAYSSKRLNLSILLPIIRKTNRLIVLLIGLFFQSNLWAAGGLSPWVLYYSNQLRPEAFDPYSLVVLDSEAHPHISPMLSAGKSVLGYISLGEVASYRHWYSEVKAEGILLKENKNWPGSFFVDLRDHRWTKRVIEELIPAILRQGFSGIFLDTLDNAGELERIDSNAYKGMTLAAAKLVRTIRRHFPEIKIMLNRGYELLPNVGDVIDMELGESVFTDYSFETKLYSRVEQDLHKEQVKILQNAAKKFPNLAIYTLDYWDPSDTSGISAIYKAERENGFNPYVSTIELDQIVPEP